MFSFTSAPVQPPHPSSFMVQVPLGQMAVATLSSWCPDQPLWTQCSLWDGWPSDMTGNPYRRKTLGKYSTIFLFKGNLDGLLVVPWGFKWMEMNPTATNWFSRYEGRTPPPPPAAGTCFCVCRVKDVKRCMDNYRKGLGWPCSVEDPFLGSLTFSGRRSNVAKEIKIQDSSICIRCQCEKSNASLQNMKS